MDHITLNPRLISLFLGLIVILSVTTFLAYYPAGPF